MPEKKIVQDILPSKRRAMRDVNLPRSRDIEKKMVESKHEVRAEKKAEKKAETKAEQREERGLRVPLHLDHAAHAEPVKAKKEDSPRKPRAKRKSGGRNIWVIVGVSLVSFLIIVYAASMLLAEASVLITPRSQNVPVNGTFTAAKNAQAPTLSFLTISTTTKSQLTVPATVVPSAEAYAIGDALLVNVSSTATQKLLAGTRLTDGRGLIYKTESTVVIPAIRTVGGKTIPGTVGVRIIASEPGPAYNSSLSDLTGDLSITAWEGAPKAQIYSGKVTSDITGGSSGEKATVLPADLSAAASNLSGSLSVTAPNALQKMVPDGYILFSKAVSSSISTTSVSSVGSTTASVSMTDTVTGVIFKRSDLINLLAKDQIAQFPANNYDVVGLDSLAFTLAPGTLVTPSISSIKFDLSGNLDIVGAIDQGAIQSQLRGVPLSSSNTVFKRYSTVISTARVSIVPFWIHTIPSSLSRIRVTVSTTTVLGH